MMATTLPMPVEFSLPQGWRSVPPDEVNAANAAFVAVHPASSKGFTANITITGESRDVETPLSEVADETLETLRRGTPDVQLGKREEAGTADNPALTQSVRVSVPYQGKPLHIVQTQAFLGMRSTREPDRLVVLHVVLSALPEQLDRVFADFQKFLSTIRPEGA